MIYVVDTILNFLYDMKNHNVKFSEEESSRYRDAKRVRDGGSLMHEESVKRTLEKCPESLSRENRGRHPVTNVKAVTFVATRVVPREF